MKAFRLVTADNLYAFVGRTSVKYIPVNEQVELELGNDREVLVKPKLMDWQKTDLRFDNNGNVAGWTIKETWEIEVQNSKDIDVVLDIRRNFAGDWDLKTEAKFEKVDATKVKFVLPLKSRGEAEVRLRGDDAVRDECDEVSEGSGGSDPRTAQQRPCSPRSVESRGARRTHRAPNFWLWQRPTRAIDSATRKH